MITEKGIVTRLGKTGASTVWVKMVPGGACGSCSERHSCNPMSDFHAREVEILNPVSAEVGDRVEVAVESSALLKATFLLYIFPIICMLLGAAAGELAAGLLRVSGSTPAVLGAVGALILALIAVKVRGNRMASRAAYRPQAIRVLARGAEPALANCTLATSRE